jgi:hypothetical protein
LQQHDEPGLPHPTHLRPQVFTTSRRFHPPRACRPCFMPDPLLGLHPPELFPLAQPYVVSDAVPLLSLGDPGLLAHRRAPKCSPIGRLRWPPSPTGVCSTRESATEHRRFRPMTSAQLSWAFHPPGFSPSLRWRDLRRTSPRGLGLHRTRTLDLGCPTGFYPQQDWLVSRKRPPTLLGFLTS